MNFYSMKNKFIGIFNEPFGMANDKLAVYAIRQMINNHKDPQIIAKDFALYRVGSFDSEKGIINTLKKPVVVVPDCSVLVREVIDPQKEVVSQEVDDE